MAKSYVPRSPAKRSASWWYNTPAAVLPRDSWARMRTSFGCPSMSMQWGIFTILYIINSYLLDIYGNPWKQLDFILYILIPQLHEHLMNSRSATAQSGHTAMRCNTDWIDFDVARIARAACGASGHVAENMRTCLSFRTCTSNSSQPSLFNFGKRWICWNIDKIR